MTVTIDEYRRKFGPWAEVFSMVLDDGRNLDIAMTPIHHLLRTIQPSPVELDLTIQGARNLFWANVSGQAIDWRHLQEMTKQPQEPIVISLFEGSFLLLDGRHRFTRAMILNHRSIRAWVVPEETCRDFRITDLPHQTEEQLRSLPVFKRRHK